MRHVSREIFTRVSNRLASGVLSYCTAVLIPSVQESHALVELWKEVVLNGEAQARDNCRSGEELRVGES